MVLYRAKHQIKHFLPPDTHTYVYVSGGKKYLFFGNFGVPCLLETPALRFALLPYYRRVVLRKSFAMSRKNPVIKCRAKLNTSKVARAFL